MSHDGHVIRARSLPEGSSEREVVLSHSVVEEGYYQCIARNDYGCEQWTTLATFTPSLPTSECVVDKCTLATAGNFQWKNVWWLCFSL